MSIPDLLAAVSKVLRPGETVVGFVEEVLRKSVALREDNQCFIGRALASRDEARKSGEYVSSVEVMAKLDGILKCLADVCFQPKNGPCLRGELSRLGRPNGST